MTEADGTLSAVINAAVYYVVAVKPSTSQLAQRADRVQQCNYYNYDYADGKLHRIPAGEQGRVTLRTSPGGGGRLAYICLKHLSVPGGPSLFPPLADEGLMPDADVTLYSAVASAESGADLPDSFFAASAGPNSDRTVMIPVAGTGARGVILLFQEVKPGADGCVGLRATFDPEIKGSV